MDHSAPIGSVTIEGRLFGAGSSRFQAVTLYQMDDRIYLRDSAMKIIGSIDLAQVVPDRPVAGLPRKLNLPSGELLEIDDHMAVEEMMAESRRTRPRRPVSLGLSFGRWVVLIGLAILMPAAFWFSYPLAADSIARSLPVSLEQTLGASSLQQFDKVLFSPSELSVSEQDRMQVLFDSIVDASSLPPDSTRLVFRRSGLLGANAVALPDGTIVMLDDLVALARRDDELIAVLAHEIGHVEHRHAIRRVVRAAGITVVASLILGDSVSMVEELVSVGLGLAEFSFSREFELEADQTAGRIMHRLNRDPEALVDLLRRVMVGCGEECEETGLFSTHPGMRDRLEALQSPR